MTKIEWTQADDGTPGKVWNPTSGCDKVSPGCGLPRFDGDLPGGCYAMAMAKRLKGMGQAKYQRDGDPRTSGPGFGITTHPDALDIPFRWRSPQRVFVNSMSDLFHEGVSGGFIARVWDVMGKCPQHQFLILTKRHARMRSWVTRWADRTDDESTEGRHGLPPMPRGPQPVRDTYTSGRARLFADMLDSMGDPPEGCAYPLYDWMEGWRWWPRVLPNVWLGCSVEDQKWADIRIPALLDTPAAIRFVSAEPLLGPIDLNWVSGIDALERDWCGGPSGGTGAPRPLLDWVIVGGESGPGARACELGWIDSLVEQCHTVEVPVFVKQLGSVLGRQFGAGAKGGDMERWPAYLQHRHFPHTSGAVPA